MQAEKYCGLNLELQVLAAHPLCNLIHQHFKCPHTSTSHTRFCIIFTWFGMLWKWVRSSGVSQASFSYLKVKRKMEIQLKQWYSPVSRQQCGGDLSWKKPQQSQTNQPPKNPKQRKEDMFRSCWRNAPVGQLGAAITRPAPANHSWREEIAVLW